MALLDTFNDPFNQTSLNASNWTQFTNGGASISYALSGAQVNFPASSTAATDGDITSVTTYSLIGSNGYLNVLAVPSSATSADGLFRLRANSTNYIQWIYEAGTLFAQQVVAGTKTTLTSFSYSSSTHAWWRIRESGGTTFWDTSTDGFTWTNRTSTANPITLTALTVLVGGVCFENETNPGTFKWRDFNTTVLSIAVSDALTTTESINATQVDTLVVNDTSTLSENVVVVRAASQDISVSESIVTSESVKLLVMNFPVVADAVTTSENRQLLEISFIATSDTIATSESTQAFVSVSITVSDPITSSESLNLRTDLNPRISDSTHLLENVTTGFLQSPYSISVSDKAILTSYRNPSTYASVGQLGTGYFGEFYLGDATNATILNTDTVFINSDANPNVIDITITSEAVTVRIVDANPRVSDAISLSENIQFAILESVSVQDAIQLNESIVPIIPVANIVPIVSSDSSTITESVRLSFSANSSVSDSSTLTEHLQVQIDSFVNKSDTVTSNENIQFSSVTGVITSDTITVSENELTAIAVFFITVSDTITLSEHISFPALTAINVSDTLTTTESISLQSSTTVIIRLLPVSIAVPGPISFTLAKTN